jgi:hypothetical protein
VKKIGVVASIDFEALAAYATNDSINHGFMPFGIKRAMEIKR